MKGADTPSAQPPASLLADAVDSVSRRGWSFPWRRSRSDAGYPDNNDDDDGSDEDPNTNTTIAPEPTGREHIWNETAASVLSHGILKLSMRSLLAATVALYVLNQRHMLNRPLSAFVSKTLFWPTLPITGGRRIGKWVTQIDDTVVMGGAPLRLLGMPQLLHDRYNVGGVINMCEEYNGPTDLYQKLGIEQLHLPTTDHFEPSLEDLVSAVDFIKRHEREGKRVYVHCRAGHGRSAAVVFSWLLYNDPLVDPRLLNMNLYGQRNVRKTLWKQPNILKLHSKLVISGDLDAIKKQICKSKDNKEPCETSDES